MSPNPFRWMVLAALLSIALPALAQEEAPPPETAASRWPAWAEEVWPTVHGFWDTRAGYRVVNDRHEKDMSLMESRLQLDLASRLDQVDFKFKGDLYGDLVMEEGDFDLREAYLAARPADFMDLWVGRQILTWGTGDMLFINDLFPKDWRSFFIGRDTDYLKAPSDAVKVSLFGDWANLDVVYTPQFDPDRYIRGERISYWNGMMGETAGRNAVISADRPDDCFTDDELALRLYRTLDAVEVAFYGYQGFWKSPGGMTPAGRALFPELSVYGFSARRPLFKGIANLELGYYRSAEDEDGDDPWINNSEFRILGGYTQELVRDLTLGVQYYLEYMMDYDAYRDALLGGTPRDRDRHVATVRLTQLALNQNLRLGLFAYYSPSDEDGYLRPNLNYKASDRLAYELGSNIFLGERPDTFFGQFQDNANVYGGVRYSF